MLNKEQDDAKKKHMNELANRIVSVCDGKESELFVSRGEWIVSLLI